MEYTVRPEEAGRRLREILRGSAGLSYTALKSAKWHGSILAEGRPVHVDYRPEAGERITVEWAAEPPVYIPRPCPMALRVPYADEDLMIIDKPAGVASQSSRNHPDDSLENAVYSWLGCPEGFIYRPVNRLDRGTGGLMAVARSAHAQHRMQQALHTADFRRRYIALVDGAPPEPEGVIDAPIAKVAEASVKRQVDPAGKPSRTRYRVLEARGRETLVLLELETGRTHQIRVHMSWLGCPVHGDFLYGTEDPESFPGCFALHSAELRMKHPRTGEALRLTSLPAWAAGISMEEIGKD